MDCADYILLSCVVDYGVRIFLIEMLVADPLICAKQADLVRDSFMHKGLKSSRADVLDNARDHVALALDRTDDRGFTGADAASATKPPRLSL